MSLNSAFKTAVSYSPQPDIAAHELAQQLQGDNVAGVIFFCSAEYDLPLLARAMSRTFNIEPLVGCTTAGEITPHGYGQRCITAIAFDSEAFAVELATIESLETFSLTDAQTLVDQLLVDCSRHGVAPIKGNTFALTLLDGLSVQEENVLVTLNAALGSIPNFGGSAGDDIHLARTHVFYNGAFHDEAAVVLMVNTTLEFEVFSTHHMTPQQEKLVVTSADVEQRCVYELNAEPAALEYARAIGVPVEELNHEIFALNPIAVRLGDEFFVRSIQRVNPDLSLTFYCAVENGIVLTVMKPGDMAADLVGNLNRIRQTIGEPQLVIGCDCFLRRLECELDGSAGKISDLLRENRVIGFNTYGEQMDGRHVNQTFTAVAIGQQGHE